MNLRLSMWNERLIKDLGRVLLIMQRLLPWPVIFIFHHRQDICRARDKCDTLGKQTFSIRNTCVGGILQKNWLDFGLCRPRRVGDCVWPIQELQHQWGQWAQHCFHHCPWTGPCVSMAGLCRFVKTSGERLPKEIFFFATNIEGAPKTYGRRDQKKIVGMG